MRWVGVLGLVLALAIVALLARRQLAATVAMPVRSGSAVAKGAAPAASAVPLLGLPSQVQGEVDAAVQRRARELQQAGEADKP